MKKPYSKLKEEAGKAMFQLGNFCAVAVVFRGIAENWNWLLIGGGFPIFVVCYLFASLLKQSAEQEEVS